MLDRHIHVLSVILEVVHLGIDIVNLNVVGIQRGAWFVGLVACLTVFPLAVRDFHLAGLHLPGFVVVLVLFGFFGHGVVLAVLLGILLTGILVIHISLIHIEFAHIDGLLTRIHFHVLGLGMAHLGVKFIDGGFHVHLEVHIVGGNLLGIDPPWLTGFVLGFLFLGLITHFGLAALERGIAHVHLVVVQVNAGSVNFCVIEVDIQVH